MIDDNILLILEIDGGTLYGLQLAIHEIIEFIHQFRLARYLSVCVISNKIHFVSISSSLYSIINDADGFAVEYLSYLPAYNATIFENLMAKSSPISPLFSEFKNILHIMDEPDG